MELKFTEFTLRERNSKTPVLNKETFSIRSGQINCVLALEALPKKLLLSTLSGKWQLYEGVLSLDGTTITQTQLRDLVELIDPAERFLPMLTVHETLKYVAFFRQAVSRPRNETQAAIEEIETLTGLTDFAQCLVQSISQATTTRLHIACELLQGKQFYVVIEPFENLEFKESLDLILMLREVCTTRKVGFIVSMSSACGHVIDKCDILTCLHQGEFIFNGRPENVRHMLCKAGLHLSSVQNPIEQLLSILTCNTDGSRAHIQSLSKVSSQQRSSSNQCNHSWLSPVDPWSHGQNHVVRETALIGDEKDNSLDVKLNFEDTSLLNGTNHIERIKSTNMAPLWAQTWRLTERNFTNARRRILFPINILQNIYILLICVLVWWRPERNEATVKDRAGLMIHIFVLVVMCTGGYQRPGNQSTNVFNRTSITCGISKQFFFTTVQWAFFALLDSVTSFPKEMSVILKEQRSQLYHTSVFCVSKTLSEIPLAIIQPCVYMTVIYWVANLRGGSAFMESIGVLIVDVVAAQSVGLLIATVIKPPKTFIVMSLGLLSMMLWGGAFNTPPMWLRWGKYASFFSYGVDAFINVEFRDGHPIECSESSMVPACSMVDPGTNTTLTNFSSNLVLGSLGITWSALENVAVLLGVTIATRLLWYICLRLQVRSQELNSK